MVLTFVDNTTVLNSTNLTKLLNWSGANLVRNSSFEDWTNPDSPATPEPVGWTYVANTSTLTREISIQFLKHGLSAAKIVKTGGAATTLSQASPAGAYYCQQRTLTAGAWVNCNTAITCQLYIDDGLTKSYSSHHSGGGSYEWLSVTKTGATGATKTAVGISIGNVSTTYIDGVILVPGEVDCPFTPGPDTTFVWNPYGGTVLYLDAQPTTGATNLDIPTLTSNWCRDGTVAVLFRYGVADTAWDGTNTKDANLVLYKKGESDTDNWIYLRPIPNIDNYGLMNEGQVWVELDSGGEITYQIETSSSNSFYCRLRPLAYLRPI